MMPDLNGMEFAVRKGGKSLPRRHLFLFFFVLFAAPFPLVLAKSLPRQIVHRAHSDNTRRKERQRQRRSDWLTRRRRSRNKYARHN